MSGGFSLVEVIVSLLVLEVGILGTAGTLLVATRTLVRAEAEERGVCEVEYVLDSLAGGASVGAGARVTGAGTTSWRVTADGRARIRHVSHVPGVVVNVSAAVPMLAGTGP